MPGTGTSSVEQPLIRDDVYVRNMAALFRCDSRLAQQIDELEDDGSVVVEAARSGVSTASVRLAANDRPLQLHSKFDPIAEAAKLADSVEIGEAFCYIVGGFGLGHHLKAHAVAAQGGCVPDRAGAEPAGAQEGVGDGRPHRRAQG